MDPLSPQLSHTRNGKNSASRAHPATSATMVVRGEGGVEHSVEFRPKSCILVLNNGGIDPKASLNLGDSSIVTAGRAQVTSSITVRVRPAHDRR